MLESLGRRIAHVRGTMRQEDFAQRLGVSRKTLIRYESDERIPGADFLQAVASAFGVDGTWLLLGVGTPPKLDLSPREAALLDNYRQSTEDAKRSLETTSALLAQSAKGAKDVKKTG